MTSLGFFSRISRACRSLIFDREERLVRAAFDKLTRRVLPSLAIGLAAGVLGAAFVASMRWASATFVASETSASSCRALFLLPFVGLAIIWTYRKAGLSPDAGTDQVVESLNSDRKAPLVLAPLIFLFSVATQLFGGSAGREGAALQLGGCVGLASGRVMRLRNVDLKVAILSGMSGGFGAVFGAPLTATVFALEIGCVGVVYYPAFLPALLAGLVGARVSSLLGFTHISRAFPSFGDGSPLTLFAVLLFGLICGACCVFFCTTIRSFATLTKNYFRNDYARSFFGGVCVVLLTLATRAPTYNGSGANMILSALEGSTPTWGFLLKTLFTAATLGACFKGGEIVPCLAVGASFGCAAGPLLGFDPSFGAALGMTALFCGTTNCPLTALVLSVELFGADNAALFAIVCASSYMTSGHAGLYRSQRILFSKLTDNFFDQRLRETLKNDLRQLDAADTEKKDRTEHEPKEDL